MFTPHEDAIPEDYVPPGVSHWHGFGNPAMPSPVWTDRSSQNLPEGLLDPRLVLRLGGASGSSAAISLRDDQDYSRPIGGVSFQSKSSFVTEANTYCNLLSVREQ